MTTTTTTGFKVRRRPLEPLEFCLRLCQTEFERSLTDKTEGVGRFGGPHWVRREVFDRDEGGVRGIGERDTDKGRPVDPTEREPRNRFE